MQFCNENGIVNSYKFRVTRKIKRDILAITRTFANEPKTSVQRITINQLLQDRISSCDYLPLESEADNVVWEFSKDFLGSRSCKMENCRNKNDHSVTNITVTLNKNTKNLTKTQLRVRSTKSINSEYGKGSHQLDNVIDLTADPLKFKPNTNDSIIEIDDSIAAAAADTSVALTENETNLISCNLKTAKEIEPPLNDLAADTEDVVLIEDRISPVKNRKRKLSKNKDISNESCDDVIYIGETCTIQQSKKKRHKESYSLRSSTAELIVNEKTANSSVKRKHTKKRRRNKKAWRNFIGQIAQSNESNAEMPFKNALSFTNGLSHTASACPSKNGFQNVLVPLLQCISNGNNVMGSTSTATSFGVRRDAESTSFSNATTFNDISNSTNSIPALFDLCKYNNTQNIIPRTGLRPIIIDGSNVAMGHTNGKQFSVKGLKIAIEYFVNKGHKVKAFVPQFRLEGGLSTDPTLLDRLQRNGYVVFTPSRKVNGRRITPYDDRYIIEYASLCGGVVVSNDNYRDLFKEKLSWKDTIENRILMYTWIDDVLLFPEDPLGQHGPRLSRFLSFP